jgi:hypothetical protein
MENEIINNKVIEIMNNEFTEIEKRKIEIINSLQQKAKKSLIIEQTNRSVINNNSKNINSIPINNINKETNNTKNDNCNNIITDNSTNNINNTVNKLKIIDMEYVNKINKNVNNINNINVNVQLVAFGSENLNEIISSSACKAIISRGMEAVPLLIEYTHFNEKIPQYQNCYISNMRDNRGIIYDGNNWITMESEDIVSTLTENSHNFLKANFDEMEDSLNPDVKKRFSGYVNNYNKKLLVSRYNKSVKGLLYNKNRIPIKQRDQFKKLNNGKV